ncbi:MAG: hypothetical protein WCK96_08180 [Methylococcales bacterium]
MNKIQINQRVIFIGLMVFDEKQPFFTKNIINKRRNTLIANDFIHAPTPVTCAKKDNSYSASLVGRE